MPDDEATVDGGRLDQLITTISGNTDSIYQLRRDVGTENVKRDRRIRWSRLASLLAIGVGVIGMFVGAIGINAAHEAHEAANKANDALETSVATRTAGQKSVCDGFEAFTNALIGLSKPSTTDEERAVAQTKIDSFEQDIEARLAGLHCNVHLLPAK